MKALGSNVPANVTADPNLSAQNLAIVNTKQERQDKRGWGDNEANV